MTTITYQLQGTPPEWAADARWYHRNLYGEQWLATLQQDTLIISGYDIGWDEIKLNLEQVEEGLGLYLGMKSPGEISENPLMNWIISLEERLWIASVLSQAKELIQIQQKVNV